MKTALSFLFLLLCLSMNCIVALGQTTYTWQGANGADWTVSTNWTPTRSTPASSDIVQFNTGTTLTVTNVPTQTVGRLLLSNSTGITLQSSLSVTLTVGNGTGDDLVIGSGSSLTLGSSANITLATSATADISGTLTVNSGMTYNTNGTSVLTTVNGPNGTIYNAGTVSASASKLSVASGGKYTHDQNGGTVPKATWNSNSTCEIIGVTATLPSQLKLQSFGNFTWNCPNQTMSSTSLGTDFATITYPIQGNFTMQNTGTGLCYFTSTAQDNYINGNFVMSGGILEITHSGGANRTVYVGGNFSMTGGTLRLSESSLIGTLNIPGDFSHTGGTITETSSGSGVFAFSKSGTQTYTSGGTISNTINFTVNSGSTLQMADASTTVTGGGTFTLSSGATLGITSTVGITSSGATGNVQVTGTRSFSTGASYTYNGSSAQVTGNGLPATVNNLTINNSAGITLSANESITNNLTISSGALDVGNGLNYSLTVGGNWNNAGTFTARNGTVTFNSGSGTQTLDGSSSSFYNLTHTTAGTLQLTTNGLSVTNSFTHSTGIFDANGQTATFTNLVTLSSGTYLASTATQTFNSGLTISGGTFTGGSGSVDINGTFMLSSGTFTSPSGIMYLSGDFSQSGGTFTHNSGTVNLDGGSQSISGTNTFNNLTINSTTGVTLSASQTVNGTLTLSNGNITTNSYTLSIASSGTVSRTAGHVIGNLNKTYSTTGSKTFEVGTANGYSPVTINLTAGSGGITVKAIQGKHPNASGNNVLLRYWTLTKDVGITNTDLVFQYLAGDVVGNETSYVIGMYESSWSFPGGSVDPGTHTASIAGVTAFSDYTMGENTSLPVELTSFTISLKNNVAQLRWKTATEINNYGFNIERKFKSESWQTIGFISGHGTVNTPQSYQFTDQLSTTNMYRKVISYRLCQIDRDGSITYSPIVSVSPGEKQKTITLMQNYPNPFSTGSNGNLSTNISFSLPYPQYVALRVYDISGREVHRLIDGTNLDAGVHTVSFFGGDIPSGMYIYELQTENGTIRKTMLLTK